MRRERTRPLEVGGVVDLDRVVASGTGGCRRARRSGGRPRGTPRCATRRTRRSRRYSGSRSWRRGRRAASWFTPDGAASPAPSRQRKTWRRRRPRTRRRARPSATRAIAASRSAGSMNGDVACTNTVTLGRGAGSTSERRRARAAAPTRSTPCGPGELGGPVRRPRRPRRARPRRSRRRRSSRRRASIAVRGEGGVHGPCDERRRPPTRARFLPGRPFEPPRAGMIAVASAVGRIAARDRRGERLRAAPSGACRSSTWRHGAKLCRADGRAVHAG